MALIQNYINNEFVKGAGPISTRLNPWTEEILQEVTESTAMDFIKALKGAKEAQENYKKLNLEDRANILQKFAEIIAERKQSLTEMEATEAGLTFKFCFDEIIDPAQKYIENLNLEVRLFNRPDLISPTGVIGISGPRSLAFLHQAKWIANCLAAGNAVILKPNSDLPGSAQRIAEILKELSLPAGMVQIINGNDIEISTLMAGHPGLAGFLYSGNFQAADNLIIEAAKRKKKVQFFLGAKNSALIHTDFDFKNNMEKILTPALMGAGQLDFNTHRIFISQSVEKEFYEAVQNYMSELSPAENINSNSPWTPILTRERKDTFMKAVERVVPEEGKILVRGAPTFTRDLPNCSDLQQDQITGPLFLITAVKYVHEMVKWTNTGYLGHSAIIWGPEASARKLAPQLNVGHVMINEWANFSDAGLPAKQSFWGLADAKWSGAFYSDVRKILPV